MIQERIIWHGIQAARLRSEDYEAVVVPGMGANCVSLRHVPTGAELLRTPKDASALADAPNVYGLPLLFPPNRMEDGTYVFEGRRYTFPINEPERHHHIHGMLSQTPFEAMGEGAWMFRADGQHPYLQFPHPFTVIREYTLTPAGLRHTVTFINDGDQAFPLGTGIHAAFRVPEGNDARLALPALREWVLDDARKLPTGEMIADSPLLRSLREGTLCPEKQPLSALIACGPGPVFLTGSQGKFVCERDDYPFIMLWNGGGGAGFVCPEPQSWAINAPNLPLPWAETGMRALRPGERATFTLALRYLPARV
ncbi:MAG: aldose 1-epimerase [Clostridia bacterium]|nr:aldose 1-epimerase [Clostridia bacterium]